MILDTALSQYKIARLTALSDNYIFVLFHTEKREAFVVDPALADPVLSFLNQEGLELKYLINTHHHHDHIGGNNELKTQFPACQIWAPQKNKDQIRSGDHWLSGGETLKLLDLKIEVMAVPGHTLGHIAYYLPELKVLFPGDTLFSFGCGRLFEGSPEMMWNSLKKLRGLPDDTLVFCAHEYTRANLNFLKHLEPENKMLDKIEKALPKGPTIPFQLKEQKEHNAFLRAEEFCKKWNLKSDTDAFAEIRKAKDNF